MFLRIFFTSLFILAPTTLYAWGPLTHVYLGTEIFYFASLLPAGLYSLLKRYKKDFIYGNIMADTTLGKSYLPEEGHSHNWQTALSLRDSARTDSEFAFALGYMTHLAADTVAHGELTMGQGSLEHVRLESAVDRLVGGRHRLSALSFSPKVQRRNDSFLQSTNPESVVFSHSANRKIFKGIVALSALNTPLGMTKKPAIDGDTGRMLELSRERMLDVLKNEQASLVIGLSPIAELAPSAIGNRFRKPAA